LSVRGNGAVRQQWQDPIDVLAAAVCTLIARDSRMPRRRVVSIIDQIPGILFVAGAIVVLGLFQGARLVAQLRRNPGAMELAGILFMAGFAVLVIFAVRRRQTDVWVTATQVFAAIVGSNLLGVTLVWPFLPSGLPVSLASTAWNGLASGVTGAFIGLPIGAAGLWLSRRWGTDSGLTERRARRGSGRDDLPTPKPDSAAAGGDSELGVTQDGPAKSDS
jgi:hypothetical protein